ncbi:bacillithiol biosynthesis cysteine-adding enzyme BshC [Lutimonas zeaxanthinifaciens]|uniref:bacillithiol biosynthesis cysteine-adding enzyme BshC n=1 Tax=Lutimonas zeaxanthinifaciens TaxID=3060215 RepID=UPI00265D3837|nr:bacillithiol biosynthesis cysteine-adding enzyme BshC [Lutimonas sp. YSD2104]WKK65147.1 bacillithiol biosynthesis cysteine-adding enzyme BshC [Lutimonas sp. YSD2104]
MRQHSTIHFKDTGYFSKLMCDYLDQNEKVNAYYNNFPNIVGFRAQIKEKGGSFSKDNRIVLHSCLIEQYKGVKLSELTSDNLELLKNENTFTITTGHQLNLFTGPLYFLYKIISVINLTRRLKSEFPENNFVPVYWMATEDHDFEEIKYFNYKGKKIKWDREPGGAVGKLSTEGLDAVYDLIEENFGKGSNAKRLKNLFREAYLEQKTLTEATRYLANELFAAYGLVIVDGDDPGLKNLFVPFIEKELLENNCFNTVSKTNESLSLNYPIQVNPREINLFYLDEGLRERILIENDEFHINNTDLVFKKEVFLKMVREHPEKFSPNVLMRPLYQEVILPNLCYIGGGGEMAYWMQLKGCFNEVEVPFPILLLRNSVLLLDSKYERKMDILGIELYEIFLDQNQLIKNKVKQISDIEIDFSKEKKVLNQMFIELKALSDKTDKSFSGAVLAQEKKQLNGLEKLEKRLLKAQKRKYAEIVDRIAGLKEQLFPKSNLQEREANFSEFYELYGDDLIPLLADCLDPLGLEFDVIRP